MSKVLAITGLTGKKSGGAFAELLQVNFNSVAGTFDEIRALVRNSSDTKSIEAKLPRLEIMRGELTNEAHLEKALTGVDTVLHIASIMLSQKITEVAAKVGVRRLIFVHTTGIYSKYKAAGEEYRRIDEAVHKICKKRNILLTILRPTMIYGNIYDGNIVKFIKMADRMKIVPMVKGGRFVLQPVHYKDLAKAYYAVLLNEQATVNKDFVLSGGSVITLRDIFVEIGKELGKKIRFVNVPFWLAYGGAVVISGLTFGKKDYREKVQRLCEPRAYSHEDATNAFGYAPMTFDAGVAEEIKEYLKSRTPGRETTDL